MEPLAWKRLLSAKRVRDLYDGPASHRVPGDSRTPFDQDYGRATFSTPVRRLQDKAQVFPLEPNDAVRTRLTHSLEVSSIARGLGQRAEDMIVNEFGNSELVRGAIPTIAATCALIHDIGNPPFGHAGEKAISSWFNDRRHLFKDFPGESAKAKEESQFAQDFLAFEGNAQTQRLLSSLQMLADRFGLNMTCGTLSASLKYVVPSNGIDPDRAEAKKHGFFASENDLIAKIKEDVGTGSARNPIAFLVEAADDIAYATVDLEDGIKKGCLDWEFLEAKLKSDASSDLLEYVLKCTHDKIDPAKLSGRARDEAMSVSFRTNAIIAMTNSAIDSFHQNYREIMSGEYHKSLLKSSKAETLVGCCKDIGFDYVYSAPQTLKLELMGRKVIHDLLSLYWEGAREIPSGKKTPPFARRALDLMSRNYQTVCTEQIANCPEGTPPDYFRMQLITDQVCGMTDSYAVTLHRELFNG